MDGIQAVADASVDIGHGHDTIAADQHDQSVGNEQALAGIQADNRNRQDDALQRKRDHADALDDPIQLGAAHDHGIHGKDNDDAGKHDRHQADNQAVFHGQPEIRVLRENLHPVFHGPSARDGFYPAGRKRIDERNQDREYLRDADQDQDQAVRPHMSGIHASTPFASLFFIRLVSPITSRMIMIMVRDSAEPSSVCCVASLENMAAIFSGIVE